jgi:hypothetical protein
MLMKYAIAVFLTFFLQNAAFSQINFPLTEVGQQACSTIVYKNNGTVPINLEHASLLKGRDFQITSITPAVPTFLKPGEMVEIAVCYLATDTLFVEDSVVVETSSNRSYFSLRGKGGIPLIYATDIDFGKVPVGTSTCKPISISNEGAFPFILTKDWILNNLTLFRMDPSSAALMPLSIPPGGHINLTICYTPEQTDFCDSSAIEWGTDIDNQYKNQIKSWSYLKGNCALSDVKSNNTDKSFSIHPNPASGNSIELILPSTLNEKITISILDILGKEVYRNEIAKGIQKTEIPIVGLPNGSYFVKIDSHMQKIEITR